MLLVGALREDHVITVGHDYARAFARHNDAAMYALLSKDAQARVTETRFAQLQQEALGLSTATQITAGKPDKVNDHLVRIPMTVNTRIFGTVNASLDLPLSGGGSGVKVDWRRNLTFPGVPMGVTLSRNVTLPPRASLLTRDGKVLASGPSRTPDPALTDVAAQTVGELGQIAPERLAELRARGVPDNATVGVSGLERALDEKLTGKPGGTLFAGARVLANSPPRQAQAVRTTIAPSVERAAVSALAGRLGGVVALNPLTGEILGFAGVAFSGLQPPGSTFKMITLTGSLAAGVAHVSDHFPIETKAVLSGVDLTNANGEYCGGSLADSFANSCNSVFAPMGVKLGANNLVATAEKFGFNSPPDISGAAMSTLPQGALIGDDLAVGSTAIGQGQVQATALQMATVAATIGLRGRKPHLTLDYAERVDNTKVRPVIDPKATILAGKLMLDVVRYGTGKLAAITGVKVAGKTGTAELQTTKKCDPTTDNPETCTNKNVADPTDTDAWFAAFAPAGEGRPRVAVGVLLVRDGAGGDTAAPAARTVLQAALAR